MAILDWRADTGYRSATTIYLEQPVPDHLRLTQENYDRAMKAPIVSIDIEVTDERPQNVKYAAIVEWGLSVLADISAIGIALSDRPDDGIVLLAPFQEREVQFLRRLCSREDVLVLYHHGQYDVRGLYLHLGVPVPNNTWDTHTAAISLGVEHLRYTGLAAQCKAYEQVIDGYVTYTVDFPEEHPDYGKTFEDRWTNWPKYEFIKGKRDVLRMLPPDMLAWYVLEDARLTFALYRAQREWAEILQYDYGYSALPSVIDRDQRYTWVTYDWCTQGMGIDRDWVREQLEVISERRFHMETQLILDGVGELTVYDNKVRYFFDICNIPRPDPTAPDQRVLFTKTGRYSFSDAAMKYYAEVYPDETAWYEFYMHLLKTESTLIGYLAHSLLDGKIHPMIGPGTITGRSSSSHPNTLNVSVAFPEAVQGMDDTYTLSARGCVVAPAGMYLAEVDYNAAEKRAQTVESGDTELAKIFRDDLDMHSMFAKVYYAKEWERLEAVLADPEATDEAKEEARHKLKKKRSDGKPLTFGRDYGMGPEKAARRMKITVDEAKALIANFDAIYWRLAQWKRDLQGAAERNFAKMQKCPHPLFAHGYVENKYGHRIMIADPSFDPETGEMRSYWYKGSNYDPQSFVADAIKEAIWEAYWALRKVGLRSRMQQQYHDALILEVVPEESVQVAEIISRCMAKAVPYHMSLVGDIYIDWPAEINHRENAEKWGFRAHQDYPIELNNEDGSPNIMTCDMGEVRHELFEEFLAWDQREIDELQERIRILLHTGPLGDANEVLLFLSIANEAEWRSWKDFPKSFEELHRIAQRSYHLLNRTNAIPMEYHYRVQKLIEFTDTVLQMRDSLKRRKRALQEARDAAG